MIGYEILIDSIQDRKSAGLLLNNCLTYSVSWYDVFLGRDDSGGNPDCIIWEFSDGSAITMGISFKCFRFTSTVDGALDALDDEFFPDGSVSALD